MERSLRLLPRYQILFDLACHMPEVNTTSVKTYFFFLKAAHDVFAAQQAFYDRFDLSEGKMVVLLLLRQAPHYRLTPSALAEAAGGPGAFWVGQTHGASGRQAHVEH